MVSQQCSELEESLYSLLSYPARPGESSAKTAITAAVETIDEDIAALLLPMIEGKSCAL
ncbi:MAG: hypothetical protein WAV54_07910 [Acidimicrobiales bacterium]